MKRVCSKFKSVMELDFKSFFFSKDKEIEFLEVHALQKKSTYSDFI